MMTSGYAHMMNFIFRCMPQDKPGEPHDYAAERKRNDRKPSKAPRGVEVTQIDLNGFSGERIVKEGNSCGWVFYIHGGGFTVGSARERRQICQYITDTFGYNCVSCNYRLAPEHLWPDQLDDTIAAWKGFLAQEHVHAADTIVAGESAGSTLALILALWLKEQGMAEPKGIMALSPSVTQAEVLPSHRENAGTDWMLRHNVEKGQLRLVYGDRKDDMSFLRDSLVSPLYGDYAGLPPVFLSASDTEALLDDSRFLCQKLVREHHPVKLDIQHGCCHAFQVFCGMPEARKSLAAGFGFFDEACRS